MKIKTIQINEAEKVPFDLDGRIMHSQPFDVIFHVLSGHGTLETVEGNTEATEYTSTFVPAGVMRGWSNAGPVDFKVLVIKDLA